MFKLFEVKEGKFKEEDKEELTAMAIENPEMFEKFVAKAQVKLSVQAPDVTMHLQGDQLSEVAIKNGIKAENMNYDYLWKLPIDYTREKGRLFLL